MAIQDLTPKHFKIISAKDKILIFDPESDPSFGLGARVGGLGGTPTGVVKNTVRKVDASINVDGNFIKDLINARLDTSSKKILSDFVFEDTDYAGAFKTGNITWDNEGTITGGSGSVYNAKGLIFAKDGTPTIILDGEVGDATFAGTLSAPSGTLGTITAGTITGATIQTAATGARLVMTIAAGIHLAAYDASENQTFYLQPAGGITIKPYANVNALDVVGLVASTADLVTFRNAAGSSNHLLAFTNAGTGNDIYGTGGSWYITKAGAITAAFYGGITEANLVDKSATESISGTWTFGTNFPLTPSSAPTTDYQVANRKFVLDSVVATNTFTAYQDIAIGQAVYISDGTEVEEQLIDTNQGSSYMNIYGVNWASAVYQADRKAKIKSVTIYLKKVVTGGNFDVTVAIRVAGTGGDAKPTGDDLATKTINTASLADSDWNKFTFATPATINKSFAVVVRAPNANGGTMKLEWKYDTTSRLTPLTLNISDDSGVNWSDVNVWDFTLKVEWLSVQGMIYLTRADYNDGRTLAYVGLAQEAIAIDATGKVQYSRVLAGFTGLTQQEYYLMNGAYSNPATYWVSSAGNINNEGGTYKKIAGIAISTTEILIK